MEDKIYTVEDAKKEILSGKCYWCGDTNAGFYHVDCARKMSDGNSKEYSSAVSSYQHKNKDITEKLVLLENLVSSQHALITRFLAK